VWILTTRPIYMAVSQNLSLLALMGKKGWKWRMMLMLNE
jgi:hypothetical protein